MWHDTHIITHFAWYTQLSSTIFKSILFINCVVCGSAFSSCSIYRIDSISSCNLCGSYVQFLRLKSRSFPFASSHSSTLADRWKIDENFHQTRSADWITTTTSNRNWKYARRYACDPQCAFPVFPPDFNEYKRAEIRRRMWYATIKTLKE